MTNFFSSHFGKINNLFKVGAYTCLTIKLLLVSLFVYAMRCVICYMTIQY